jgi:hypothetical protein
MLGDWMLTGPARPGDVRTSADLHLCFQLTFQLAELRLKADLKLIVRRPYAHSASTRTASQTIGGPQIICTPSIRVLDLPA